MPVSELWRTALRPAFLDAKDVSDAVLLDRFCAAGDKAAFELLVYRHGPMVWGACRRILGNHHFAEDAFQATFLALTQRSGRIGHSVPGWLHRVAVRAGLDVLRRTRANPSPQPGGEPIDPQPGPLEQAALAELSRQIDVAVNRLPERLRLAFVLCDLEGHSLKAAAAHLACPVGTVESRLARARRRLRGWLAPFQPAAGVALAAVAVPSRLRAETMRTAFAGAVARPALVALAARAAGGFTWYPALFWMAFALTAALLGAAVALGKSQSPEQPPSSTVIESLQARTLSDAHAHVAGDALPQGAVARLGSARLRHGDTASTPVAFSPDDQRVAAGDSTGVTVFDTQTGKRLRHYPVAQGHTPCVVRFVAKGTQLAIGSGDWGHAAEVAIFDLKSGQKVGAAEFVGKQQIFIIDITNDGKQVLIEDRFEKVYMWDVTAARQIWEFKHPEAAFTLPLAADGKSFVLARSKSAELRDAATGKVTALFPAPGPKFRSFYDAAGISADGKLAIASEASDSIAILDARDGKAVKTFKCSHEIVRLFFSPDGRYVVGLGPLGTLVWDTTAAADAGPIARLPGAARGGFAMDGKVLALDDVGYLTLWRVGMWTMLPQSAEPASQVDRVGLSPDGKHVIGYTRGGWVRWPLAGGAATPISDASAVFHEGMAQISDDGSKGADLLHEPGPGRSDGKFALRITDFVTAKALRIEIVGAVWDPFRLSSDGRFVSAITERSEFVVWDTSTGKETLRLKRTAKERFLSGAQLAKDGKSIARSVSGEWVGNSTMDFHRPYYKAMFVTDHGQAREHALVPLPWSVYSGGVQFSVDGTKVVVEGHFDEDWKKDTVVVWDVASGRRLASWTRQGGRIDAVKLSPDGRSLIVGDGSGKLAVVEIASGQERMSFRHAGIILSAAFHPDGTKVIASSPEAPIYVWDLLANVPPWVAASADSLWLDLSSEDAKVAFDAMRTLRTHPAQAHALLKERVKTPVAPSEQAVDQWLKQLDSAKFAEREQATKELLKVADLIQQRLQVARQKAPLETTRRLNLILESIANPTPENLRVVRACEVLEGMGGQAASQLLKTWAAAPAGSKLATEASQSAARLAGR